MPGVFFQRRHSLQNVDGSSTRRAAVEDLQKNLASFKLRSANRDMDVARNLLQQNIHLISLQDQEVIGLLYDDLEDIEERREKTKSLLDRWVLTRHFKRVSKTTSMVIKSASDRAIDRHIRNKLREATSSRAPLPDIPESTTVQHISPDPPAGYSFIDPHQASTQTDTVVGNVDSVDMTALQSTTTGEPAVLVRVRRQDEPPQHFVAAFFPDHPPGHGIADDVETTSFSSPLHPQFQLSTSDVFGSDEGA
jgi:hypothetical protein